MKTRFILLFSLLSSIANMLVAQHTINGQIVDQDNNGIPFATVSLFQASDSTLVQATSCDVNGQFQLNKITLNSYYIETNMLGYSNSYFSVQAKQIKANQPIRIKLKENSALMDAIEIKSRVPLVEQKSDRLIVNVENNLSSLNSSVMDVMKKIPGVVVTGDQLSMAGQQNITILINGKSTKYMDLSSVLHDLPGDNIKKVEVIHQPGAEFDAEGVQAVINIILKKNTLLGTNGSVKLGIAKAHHYRGQAGINLSHNVGKLSINTSAGIRKKSNNESLYLNRKIQDERLVSLNINPNLGHSYRGSLSIDYELSDRISIGINNDYNKILYNYESNNVTSISNIREPNSKIDIKSINHENIQKDIFSSNPYLTWKLDTSGQKIVMDYNFAYFKNNKTNTLENSIVKDPSFYPNNQFDILGNTFIHAAKIDYSNPIIKGLHIQGGLKLSAANLDNNFKAFKEEEQKGFIEQTNESNHFLFDESIYAAYTKLNWNYGKWDGTAGIRYEDSRRSGRSLQTDRKIVSRSKRFFPSLSLGREINKLLSTNIVYSYRIGRPNYSSLNPFQYHIDPFTAHKGNPMLSPAFTNSLKINLNVSGQPILGFEIKDTKDAIHKILREDKVNKQINQQYINFNSIKSYQSSLFFPLNFIPRVNGYGGVFATYFQYNTTLENEIFELNRWNVMSFINMNISLPYDINAELSSWISNGEIEGQLVSDMLYGVDIGFSKKLLNQKASISIGVENLFYKAFYAQAKFGGVDLDVISDWDAPVINMQFSYRFGNQNIKKKRKIGGSGQETINRAQ